MECAPFDFGMAENRWPTRMSLLLWVCYFLGFGHVRHGEKRHGPVSGGMEFVAVTRKGVFLCAWDLAVDGEWESGNGFGVVEALLRAEEFRIPSKTQNYPVPFDYQWEEAQLLPSSKHSLKKQATNLRNIVRFLEHTMHIYPRYKKTGASSPVNLGFHRSLVGGFRARPNFQYQDLLSLNSL